MLFLFCFLGDRSRPGAAGWNRPMAGSAEPKVPLSPRNFCSKRDHSGPVSACCEGKLGF